MDENLLYSILNILVVDGVAILLSALMIILLIVIDKIRHNKKKRK